MKYSPGASFRQVSGGVSLVSGVDERFWRWDCWMMYHLSNYHPEFKSAWNVLVSEAFHHHFCTYASDDMAAVQVWKL